jgi:hypothetical protein
MLGWVFFVAITILPVVGGGAVRRLRKRDGDRFGAAWIHLVPALAIAGVSAAAAYAVYIDRDPTVLGSAALAGTLITLAAVALPMIAYYLLGLNVRPTWVIVPVWLGSLIPLAVYAFVLGFAVIAKMQCGPDAYECPV